jgi:hypothetical protein
MLNILWLCQKSTSLQFRYLLEILTATGTIVFLMQAERNKIRPAFEITTDNPEVRPLSSIALLEMQWFLQRVIGMAGAADVEEDYDCYFSDSEASNLALADNTSLRPLLETS